MHRGRKPRAEDRRRSGVKSSELPVEGRSANPPQAQPPAARKRKAKRRVDPPPVIAAAPPGPAKDQAPKAKRAAPAKKKRATAKRTKAPTPRGRKAALKPHRAPLVTPAVIALPYRPEPLVEPEPAIDLAAWSALAPAQPILAPGAPQSRELAPYRSGGLLVAVADWIGTRSQQLWQRISRAKPPAPKHRFRSLRPLRLDPRRPAREEAELLRLKAENEQLRLQLEALLALQTGAGVKQAVTSA